MTYGPKPRTTIAELAAHVRARSTLLPSGCREFNGSTVKGYGVVAMLGRKVLAHRVTWEDAHGPIPASLCVLHRCDNPPCVNPDHLFLGTRQDNADDMVAKGRHWHQRTDRCKWGHPLAGDNLRISYNPRGRAFRVCRACAARRMAAFKARQAS